jgi:hypothetical protein
MRDGAAVWRRPSKALSVSLRPDSRKPCSPCLATAGEKGSESRGWYRGHWCGVSHCFDHTPCHLTQGEPGPSSVPCPHRPSSQTSSLSRGPRHCGCRLSWRPANMCRGTLCDCPRPCRYSLVSLPGWCSPHDLTWSLENSPPTWGRPLPPSGAFVVLPLSRCSKTSGNSFVCISVSHTCPAHRLEEHSCQRPTNGQLHPDFPKLCS